MSLEGSDAASMTTQYRRHTTDFNVVDVNGARLSPKYKKRREGFGMQRPTQGVDRFGLRGL